MPLWHGWHKSSTKLWRDVLTCFTDVPLQLLFAWGLSFCFKIVQRCSMGFRSCEIFGQMMVFTFFFLKTSCVCFAVCVCLGSLSCLNSQFLLNVLRLGITFSVGILYTLVFVMPSIKVISPSVHLLNSCNPILADSLLHLSQLALCSHCDGPGQVHTKHAEPHLIQTNLSLFSFDQRICYQYSSSFFSCPLANLSLCHFGILSGH